MDGRGEDPSAAAPVPSVTVVVPTFRRRARLARLLRALEAQTLPAERFSVVVVDDASDDGTAAMLRTYASTSPMRLTVCRQPRNRGPAAARNRGLAEATAPVVAFTDDDCVPDRHWLEAGLTALAAGDGARAGVAGRTVPAADQPEGPFSRTLRVDDARFMQTCNVFYRRDVLATVDGFDERLRTGEDTDLGLRVRAAGHEVAFSPDALVVHDVRPSDLRAALRDAARWVDLPAVVRRHPGVRRDYLTAGLFWKPTHPPAMLAAAGSAAAVLAAGRWSRGTRVGVSVLALLPWLRRRWVVQPLAAGRAARARALPGALAVDLAEVATMVRGSVRHRTLVL